MTQNHLNFCFLLPTKSCKLVQVANQPPSSYQLAVCTQRNGTGSFSVYTCSVSRFSIYRTEPSLIRKVPAIAVCGRDKMQMGKSSAHFTGMSFAVKKGPYLLLSMWLWKIQVLTHGSAGIMSSLAWCKCPCSICSKGLIKLNIRSNPFPEFLHVATSLIIPKVRLIINHIS